MKDEHDNLRKKTAGIVYFVSNEMKTKLKNGNFAYDETRAVVIVGGGHEILHSRLPLLS